MKSFEQVIDFHGHACPGLALGYRVSALALKELGPRDVDEQIVAVVENDSCAVDAVQVMTGCTFGKGNLVFHDYGKQVYTFHHRPSGRSLRIAVHWTAPEETPGEKEAWDKYKGGQRSDEVQKVVHDRKSRKIKAVLDATDEELFGISWLEAAPPPTARIYPSLECGICGEKVMEPKARIMNGTTVCMPCMQKETEQRG